MPACSYVFNVSCSVSEQVFWLWPSPSMCDLSVRGQVTWVGSGAAARGSVRARAVGGRRGCRGSVAGALCEPSGSRPTNRPPGPTSAGHRAGCLPPPVTALSAGSPRLPEMTVTRRSPADGRRDSRLSFRVQSALGCHKPPLYNCIGSRHVVALRCIAVRCDLSLPRSERMRAKQTFRGDRSSVSS